MQVVRNSGATLTLGCVVKQGPGLAAQALFMRRAPETFIRVMAVDPTRESYAMPGVELRPLELADVREGLRRLDALHAHRDAVAWNAPCSVDDYHKYVLTRCPTELLPTLDDAYRRLRKRELRRVSAVHGDATLENLLPGGLWIDPNVRSVPSVRELDAAKLWQSREGYSGEIGPVLRSAIEEYVAPCDPVGVWYFFISHLARLWRYQPEKRDWALSVALKGWP